MCGVPLVFLKNHPSPKKSGTPPQKKTRPKHKRKHTKSCGSQMVSLFTNPTPPNRNEARSKTTEKCATNIRNPSEFRGFPPASASRRAKAGRSSSSSRPASKAARMASWLVFVSSRFSGFRRQVKLTLKKTCGFNPH